MPASERPTFRHNPYVEGLAYRIKTRKKAGFSGSVRVLDQDTGTEGPELAYFAKTREVDSEQFVKLYADGVDMLCNLSAPARNVLRVFLRAYLWDPNNFTDSVTLPYRWACNDYGYPYGRTTWIKGVNDLSEHNVIAQTEGTQAQFFVNPEYFIKGDRIALVKEFKLRPLTERPVK